MWKIAIVIIIILLLGYYYYYYYYLPSMVAASATAPVSSTPPALLAVSTGSSAPAPSTSTEHFDPTYDRTFSQSLLDHQMDRTQDQKGYTVDDYMLGDLLYKRHGPAMPGAPPTSVQTATPVASPTSTSEYFRW